MNRAELRRLTGSERTEVAKAVRNMQVELNTKVASIDKDIRSRAVQLILKEVIPLVKESYIEVMNLGVPDEFENLSENDRADKLSKVFAEKLRYVK